MVGYLIIADKGCVSRRHAGIEVADEGVDIQLAQNGSRHTSHQGVFEVAMMFVQAGLDVVAPLLPEAVTLQILCPRKKAARCG